MANLTVRDLMDTVQELLGEPIGGFYNISRRLSHMNQAQREMVEEARALLSSGTVNVVSGTRDYDVPTGFMTFSQESPYFVPTSGSSRVTLKVTTESFLDDAYPQWQDDDTYEGTPMYIVLRNGTLTLHPNPDAAGTLTVPFVVDPTELADMDDVPFNGISRLNRHAMGLAFYSAFLSAMGRAPQQAMVYKDLYEKELREMRHYVRTSPQHQLSVRPKPLEE